MAGINYNRVLPSAQVRFRDRMIALMRGASQRIAGVLATYANADGIIPLSQREEVARRAGDIVQALFVVDGRISLQPDGTPVSPYARALMAEIGMVTVGVVNAHARYMRNQLDPLTLTILESGGRTISELAHMRHGYTPGDHTRIIEQVAGLSDEEIARLRIFSPNPMAEYEPAHTWVDPRGYILSQRIWNTSTETRRKLDALMMDLINQGKSSQQITRLVEQFLIPGRAKIRTNKPYGSDASYDAMRLARTEIARAHNQAAWASALLNPYVDKIRMRRSTRGQHDCPVCPQYAGEVGGEGILYSVYSAVIGPYHPHCMCYLVPEVTDNPQVVTIRLQNLLDQAQADLLEPFLTPVAVTGFIDMLLGEALAQMIPQLLPIQAPLF